MTRSDAELRHILRTTLEAALGTDLTGVPDDRPLTALGLDSISCALWLRRIEAELGTAPSPHDVYAHPTIAALGTVLLRAPGDAMNSHSPDVLAHLRESLAAELELPEREIAPDVPFAELGLDSITGVTWTRKINTRFRQTLSVTELYRHPTLDELARHLGGLLDAIPAAPEVVPAAEQGRPVATPPAAVAGPAAGLRSVVAELRAGLAQELELAESDVDDDTPFVELGLDSITGVTWTRKINTAFGLALPVTTLYRYPTITDLARHLTGAGGLAGLPEPPRVPAVTVTAPQPAPEPEPEPGSAPQPVATGRAVELVDIAIVGMSGAFPGAANLAEFWQAIEQGRDCVSEVPASRWPVEKFYDPVPGTPGKSYSRWMGVLEHADEFDPLFFGLTPVQAEQMDPQQRVLLQESWRCVESAGYSAEALSGSRCGVFVGCSANGYGGWVDETGISAHLNLGTSNAIMASRISYLLNLRGPCLAIDTSCSSSLVAIATACDSLCLGESDTALAGGVWVLPGPGLHVAMSQLRALSPDGRCFAFDERANGFVPAEGVGVLMLKRLADARADGDRIHAVIKGWGVNQDGRSNGITAPNADAQAELIARVHDRFGLDPADIDLVEAHGTGTSLGDPVEIDGLVRGFGDRAGSAGHCAIGSVKSIIGHTACAAGVASTIKAVLALEHRIVPPTGQHQRLNPHIELDGTPLHVSTEARPWPRRAAPRMAAVSSFGYSGTNAHLVLAEEPEIPAAPAEPGRHPVVLSARTEDQLVRQVEQLLGYLRETPSVSVRDLSFTLSTGRKHFAHRVGVLAADAAELIATFTTWLTSRTTPAADDPALATWLGGGPVAWAQRFTGTRPARLDLPTYPFARESYWLAREGGDPDATHPMLHRQLPDSGGAARFGSTFHGGESFLRDHRVQGSRVLPAAAHFELARAAVARAAGGRAAVRLEDIVLLRPAVCATGLDLRIEVGPDNAYRITAGGEVLSEGRARLEPFGDTTIDLEALRAACRTEIPAGTLYRRYEDAGLAYGPAHRSVVALHTGSGVDGRPQVLAELTVPAAADALTGCVLHPSVLDGALQATLGLALESDRAALPFAVAAVRCPATPPAAGPAFAWIRYQPGSGPLVRLDVTVADGSGRVRCELIGLAAREIPVAAEPATGDLLGFLLAELSGALKLTGDQLDPDAPFERYGMDSILAMELTTRLERTFGPLPKTLFFEVRTVRELSAHLAEQYPGVTTTATALPVPVPAPVGRPAAPRENADIAIIGVSGRYPMARDLDEFWVNLREGRDCVTEIPAERWDHTEYFSTDKDVPGTSYGKWGGFLDGVDEFDALLFKISPREAAHLDPQERLFLQCVHHTLEDAGHTGATLGRQCGVYVGVMYEEYQLHGAQAQARGQNVTLSGSPSAIANRVSHHFDFHGPSMAVDTMCSSSITAIHLACEAIRAGHCDTAVAGGVNVSVHPNKYLMLSQGKYLSSDGRCRSFGADGDGYVPGEGVGAVLLKPLDAAIADGDHVHGVIKATALNHGGATHGFSVPSPVAQGEVITRALAAAGVSPSELSYLEAHGTGTALGDPIELAGLVRAFGAGGTDRPCPVGSVKSNIGHLESAAGIAALTKVLLQLRHRQLVPSLHSATLNPNLTFDGTPLRVQRELTDWPAPHGTARLAGISSFGAGGSNAHLVIAEHLPADEPAEPAGEPQILVLSAQTEDQLVAQARALLDRLRALRPADLPSVAWTLQTGRVALGERLAFTADSPEAAARTLAAFVADPAGNGPWVRGRAGSRPAVSGTDPAADWVRGAAVDWAARWGSRTPRRISLPGYPFARERHWFDSIITDAEDVQAAQGTQTAQAAENARAAGGVEVAGRSEVLLLRPVWRQGAAEHPAQPVKRHIVVLGSDADPAAFTAGSAAACTVLPVPAGRLDEQYTELTQRVFAVVRELLDPSPREPVLVQVALTGSAPAVLTGLSGLLRSAGQENPRLLTQLVDCRDTGDPTEVAARLLADAHRAADAHVRYRDGVREVAGIEELPAPSAVRVPWRDGAVYLITGGAGGLGLVTARAIAAATTGATVVLTGRSALTGERERAVESLRANGLSVDYRQADVTDRAAVAGLLDGIDRDHGRLDGVVHAAGVLRDGFVIRKSPADVADVLAAKVAGLVHLDELTAGRPLHLFVCFSSMTSVLGNAGQSDYAAANGFLDAYAAHRADLVARGERHGRTLSVSWPLWAEGGMGVGDAVLAQLRAIGVVPLSTPDGIGALHAGLAADRDAGRLLVLSGDRDELLARTGAAPGPAPAGGRVDRAALARHLRRVVATALRLDPARLDEDTPVDNYGMDSVVSLEVVATLEGDFGPQPKTLLFETPTISGLVDHLVSGNPDAVVARFPASAPRRTRVTALAPARPKPAAGPKPAADPATGDEGIAVIGITGRYPGAEDLDRFWANLITGTDSVTEVPADRWDHDAVYDPDRDAPGRSYGRWGGFIDGVDQFDPLLFGISPREAQGMDPQQRLFLETVFELFERGGITQDQLRERYGRQVGVYVGAMYQLYRAPADEPALRALTATTSYNLIANRVSGHFGLEGPSLAVDSMCSSSSMAIHLACADLRRGETRLAVAGGVNLTIHQDKFIALAQGQLLASHPASRSFRDGDGYLPAEGVGAVLLKRLSDALADGDPVLAVIRGSATRHTGRDNRLFAPNYRTHVEVMRHALRRSGAQPSSVGCLEAAATGSAVADAVEARALREVFADAAEPVRVGTVKSAIGHPEAVSGIAQLTKVVLQLRHGRIAPLVELGAPNPNLDLDGTGIVLCERPADWTDRRRALINSVGAGGSHVSMVVDAPPAQAADTDDDDHEPQLIVLSALDGDRLRASMRRLLTLAEGDDEIRLANLAYTLQVGRDPRPHRCAFVASTWKEVRRILERHLDGDEDSGVEVSDGAGDGAVTGLLSGPRADEFLTGLVADGELARLAALWVRGAAVPWHGLHEGRRRRVLPVLTTVFRHERYWLDGTTTVPAAPPAPPRPAPRAANTPRDYVVRFFADALGLAEADIPLHRNLQHVGVDSILWARLSRAVEADLGIELTAREIVEHGTIAGITDHLATKSAVPAGPGPDEPAGPDEPVSRRRAKALEDFRQGRIGLVEIKKIMKEVGA